MMKAFKRAALALLLYGALATTAAVGTFTSTPAQAEAPQALKDEVAAEVEAQRKQIQVMVDQIFSFAEPGFQEVRTSAYLTEILEKNGFTVERGHLDQLGVKYPTITKPAK